MTKVAATIDVFYYTGEHTETLLPAADALLSRLSPARRERLLRHVEGQRIIELAALRILELGMEVRGIAEFALKDVEYVQVAGVTKKPFWTRGDVSFSISHTNSIAMVAIASSGAVGVDVERAREIDPRVVRRLLNDAATILPGLTPQNAVAYWTQLEAILKGAGVGVMHGKEIEWSADRILLREKQWYVHPVACGPAHVAHVASDVEAVRVNPVRIEIL